MSIEIHEHHLPVRRTARYHTLGHGRTAVEEIWIVCHGYGQLAAKFLRRFEPIDAPHRLIVAPEALNRFYLGDVGGSHGADAKVGATWMTREDRLSDIDDYVEYLDALVDAVGESGRGGGGGGRTGARLVALGFSQGVATVSRWLAHGRARAAHVILWGSHLPPELRPEADGLFHGARVSIVVGGRDSFATREAVAAERARLDEMGVAYDFVPYDGGHEIDGDTLKRLAGA